MASKKAEGVVAVDVDGTRVEVDMGYIRSWAGVVQAGRMASTQMSDGERFLAMVDYYTSAIANVEEVTEAVGERPADEVFAMLSDAVKEATPKN